MFLQTQRAVLRLGPNVKHCLEYGSNWKMVAGVLRVRQAACSGRFIRLKTASVGSTDPPTPWLSTSPNEPARFPIYIPGVLSPLLKTQLQHQHWTNNLTSRRHPSPVLGRRLTGNGKCVS